MVRRPGWDTIGRDMVIEHLLRAGQELQCLSKGDPRLPLGRCSLDGKHASGLLAFAGGADEARELHNLTHVPYQPWCIACVRADSKLHQLVCVCVRVCACVSVASEASTCAIWHNIRYNTYIQSDWGMYVKKAGEGKGTGRRIQQLTKTTLGVPHGHSPQSESAGAVRAIGTRATL